VAARIATSIGTAGELYRCRRIIKSCRRRRHWEHPSPAWQNRQKGSEKTPVRVPRHVGQRDAPCPLTGHSVIWSDTLRAPHVPTGDGSPKGVEGAVHRVERWEPHTAIRGVRMARA
jgi:hypothetical protein